METNSIFQQVNNSASMDSSVIIKSLFEFAKLINQMSDDDLISFYQALVLLKKSQPINIFKRNQLRINIEEVQRMVCQAMKASLSSTRNDCKSLPAETMLLQRRFENALGHQMY